jgi:hypothetical protein
VFCCGSETILPRVNRDPDFQEPLGCDCQDSITSPNVSVFVLAAAFKIFMSCSWSPCSGGGVGLRHQEGLVFPLFLSLYLISRNDLVLVAPWPFCLDSEPSSVLSLV